MFILNLNKFNLELAKIGTINTKFNATNYLFFDFGVFIFL